MNTAAIMVAVSSVGNTEALTLPFHVIRNELLDGFSNGE